MSQLFLYNARVILEDRIQHGGVLIRDGRIARVFSAGEIPAGLSSAERVDLKDAYLAPGLIDIHIHGSVGIDVQAADEVGLRKFSEFLLTEGVTGYFATLVPTDEEGYRAALRNIGSYIAQQAHANRNNQPLRGARMLGIHFEGPFVSAHRCGALHRAHFRTYDGDARSIELFTGGSSEEEKSRIICLMTLAPEVEGGLELTRALSRRGVRVFIGHSQAEPETLDLAAEAGAHHITHFPNALDPLHHRKPGAVAWGLVRDDVTIDCIADFHHVHPLMLRLMVQSKGADRMALISDAIMPAGLGDGEFSVWGERIHVRDGRTALARHEDTIAGSVISMRQALKNIVNIGVPLHDAVRMASNIPARAAGIESDLGSIREGKNADLIAFDDEFNIQSANIRGAMVDRLS